MEQAGRRGGQMYGMMRGQKKRDSWREEEEGVLCGAMKKWDFFF